jgi:hypothetical protein
MSAIWHKNLSAGISQDLDIALLPWKIFQCSILSDKIQQPY